MLPNSPPPQRRRHRRRAPARAAALPTAARTCSTQPLLAADIDADLSGVQANADVLGHDLADIKIGLGIIDDVLGLVDDGVGTGLGLVDLGLGVVDDVLCGIA